MLVLEPNKIYEATGRGVLASNFDGQITVYGEPGSFHLCISNTLISIHNNKTLNVLEMLLLNTGVKYVLALDDEMIALTYRESGARVKRNKKSKGHTPK